MSREELNEWIGADAEATNKMTGRDITFIKRLIKWITDNADYGDISELCEELNVDEEWFSRFYWDDSEE